MKGKYEEIINSNSEKWGGTGTFINDKVITSKNVYEESEKEIKSSETCVKTISESLKENVSKILSNSKSDKEIKEEDLDKDVKDESKKIHGRENYIEVKIPKLSAVILKLKETI